MRIPQEKDRVVIGEITGMIECVTLTQRMCSVKFDPYDDGDPCSLMYFDDPFWDLMGVRTGFIKTKDQVRQLNQMGWRYGCKKVVSFGLYNFSQLEYDESSNSWHPRFVGDPSSTVRG